MREFTKAQKARHAIREFKTLTDASAIRGFYRPCGKMGKALEQCLRNLSPEIYGSMNDPRIVELKGLEYVIDRLPKGIEECNRIILTEEDPFKNDTLQPTLPLKRRRTCYRVGQNEMCFVITRGLSEIYDILTHMTFLVVEARKIPQPHDRRFRQPHHRMERTGKNRSSSGPVLRCRFGPGPVEPEHHLRPPLPGNPGHVSLP